jgi:PAS domain S-box-containing protein
VNPIESTKTPSAAPGLAPFGQEADIRALADAFELFTRTTQTMEESYRRLEGRLQELDRELEAKNRELAITSDYLSSLMESMSDGVIAVDTQGVITTFNRAASQVLEIDARDAVGQPFIELFGREFSLPSGRHSRELRAKDGRTVQVSESNSPLFDRALRRIGTVKVFQDQTEIESLRTRLQHQDRLAAIGQMAATVAHEIRNPLGGICGFAALLARDIEDADPRARLVEKVLAGAKALERVVTDLLEFTRPLQLRVQTVPLRELVASSLTYIDTGARTIAFENRVDDRIQVTADADKLRQVLLNIVLNAVQSIAQSGLIEIRSRVVDHWIELYISDDGCGMSTEQLDQIFSPFFTTKEKGTGLGLAIAAKIIEAHGGRITVTSTPAQGSVFTIALPRAE